MPGLDERAEYVIRLEGCVDADLVRRMGPMDVEHRAEGGTTLSGLFTDQAGLVGLIRYLHGMDIVLLSVERRDRPVGRAEGG